MLLERSRVEQEVRRRDHGHRRSTRLGRVRRERCRLGGRLGAAVRGDIEPSGGSGQEQLERALALVSAQQDPFAGRSEREDPVDSAVREERDVRLERVLVELGPAAAKRRQRRRDGPVDQNGPLGS